MEKIDFHIHSNASDGLYSPKKIIDLALENNLTALALTDHDTVSGLASAKSYAQNKINFIPGIEFSVDYPKGSFHLLGLGIDESNSQIKKATIILLKHREERFYQIIDKLKKEGIKIPVKEFEDKKDEALGRPHLARIMVKYGYGKTIDDIFNNYLTKGKPGYVRKKKISLPEAISCIKGAGGIPVIAHPISLKFENFVEFEKILLTFIAEGVVGLEVFSKQHNEDHLKNFYTLAQKYNLFISGGSDFHGDREEQLGYYSSQKLIPSKIYEDFKNYKKC